jgi:hypothetical protein
VSCSPNRDRKSIRRFSGVYAEAQGGRQNSIFRIDAVKVGSQRACEHFSCHRFSGAAVTGKERADAEAPVYFAVKAPFQLPWYSEPNAVASALEMGHTNAAITFAHYRELVKPSDAALYWNLVPSVSASEKVVPMSAPR